MNFCENYGATSTETSHVFEKNRQVCNDALSEKAIVTTPIDWDNLESITLSGRDEAETFSYNQALEYFKGIDLSEYNEKIITTVRKSRNIFACFLNLRKSRIKQEHIDDYNLLFLIAKCPYEKDNKMHIAMLRTVYDSLVLNKDLHFSWENIGFQVNYHKYNDGIKYQSNLPWTDLRGVGMLGVLQLLYLCTSCPLLRNMLYELSINEFNTFPFAVVSLNMTSIVLNVLRQERLNCDVNIEGVFVCINKLYAAIFHHFGKTWTNEQKTIVDISKLFKDVERLCLSKRARKKMIKDMELCV